MMTVLFVAACLSLIGLSDPIEVSGVVQDPDGRPIADAEVFLESPTESDPTKKSLGSVKSNALGEFAIRPMSDSKAVKASYFQLVVAKPGWTFGGQTLPAQQTSGPPHITLRMRKSHRITVRLLSPQGKPVPNARLAVSMISLDETSYAQLGSLSEKFARTTNADGEAELDGVVKGRMLQVTATASGFGQQSLPIAEAGDKGEVTLGEVGLLRGKLTAPSDRSLNGLRVTAMTQTRTGMSYRKSVGTATTNEQGEFEIADLMAGQGNVTVATPADFDLLAQSAAMITAKAGESTTVEIKLSIAKRVIGLIRDAETKKPIADVTVFMHVTQRSETATSDKDGKFRIKMLPGTGYLSLQSVPAPYIVPANDYRQLTLPESFADGHEPAEAVFELQRGESVTGSVEDADGRPVSGANITAAFIFREGQYGALRQSTAKSGKDGEFTLSALARSATLIVTAQTDDTATVEPVRFAIASKSPLKLVVSPVGLFQLTGRITDSRQQGVAKAKLELRSQQKDEHGNFMSSARVPAPGLTTDADGKFTVPKKLARSAAYQLHIDADGFLKQRIPITPPKSGPPEFVLTDIVVSRLTKVSGRVVDRDGKPVPQATVSALSDASGNDAATLPMAKTETDAEGRFQLANVNPEAKFCYAHKLGFRFQGAVIPSARMGAESQLAGDSPSEVEFQLVRPDEPLLERMQTVTDRFPTAQRREWLQTLRSQIEKLPATPEFAFLREELATQFVGVDDELVEAHLQNATAPRLLVPLLVKLKRLDDAAEVAQQEPQPYQRLFLLRTVYDSVTDAAAKKDLLAQALVAARTVPDPAQRVVCQGIVAEKLLDLGDRKAAEQLVKETLPLAKELAPSDLSGYARSNFAETLCFFDLDVALAIVKEMKPDDQDRHIGNIAHELANVRPAEAERILSLCRTGWNFDQYAVRVCYRMATVDLDRALKIAESIGSPRGMKQNDNRDAAQRPFAFATMAHALAKSAPDRAKQLLRQAVESLPSYQHDQISQSDWMPALAQRVVHWSETIDPDSTPEYLWRAIHSLDATEPFRYGHDGNYELQRQRQRAGIWLGLLARYGQFPSESRRWITPLLPKADEFAKSHAHREVASLLAAWTLLAPEDALAWHAELIPLGSDPGNNALRIYPQPTSIIVRSLSGQEADLIDFIDRHSSFSLWIPDTEDL